MSQAHNTDVLVKIVALLEPLTPEERQRVIKAAFMLMGDTEVLGSDKGSAGSGTEEDTFTEGLNLEPRVKNWMKQNNLTLDALQQVFHFGEGGKIEIIANEIPGKSEREKTHSAYILVGISNFIESGQLIFDDKIARNLCENLGCLNKGNHASYLKAIGNVLTGSKEKGWTLTAPGMKQAVIILKEMTSN